MAPGLKGNDGNAIIASHYASSLLRIYNLFKGNPALIRSAPMIKQAALIEPLTRRELEILALLAKHHTNKEIAANLSLSVNSVKWYARQIYGKLGIENRRQAAIRAIELGLLAADSIDEKSSDQSITTDTFVLTTTIHKPKHNIPLQLTSFVGRKLEIEQVKRLLSTSRLVTLTGSGGVGKTRLALAVALQVMDEFKNGVWLVELAPIGDPEIIPGTIAMIFGVHADQNRSLRTALLDYLREKQVLLILDNCEHLIDACAEIADAILRSCPQAYILASSREALGVEGEAPFYVPSLSYPEPGKYSGIQSLESYQSVKLFLDRARLVFPEFIITEDNASSLAQICQRLDGIPLALELAAARLQVLSLEQISARLDDRFRLLTGGSRRALPRHQTLHALIDWSYELLTEAERTLFRRLSVFASVWTLEAAEAVCSDTYLTKLSSARQAAQPFASTEILDLLTGLTHKSLITVVRNGDVMLRCRMMETIRQYAQEKLVETGEAARFRDRHLEYYLGLAEESEPLMRGSQVLTCLERLDGEVGNLRLALSWALGGASSDRIVEGLRLASALGYYWYGRSLLDEGCVWLKRGLELIPKEKDFQVLLRAKVMFVINFLVLNSLDFTRIAEARPLLEESITLFQECNDRVGQALARGVLGVSLMSRYITSFGYSHEPEEYPLARVLGIEGLAVCRELGKPHDLAFALTMILIIYSEGMEIEKARAYGEEALRQCEKNGVKIFIGDILSRLGFLALALGDLSGAQRYMQKGLILGQELNDRLVTMSAFFGLGEVAYFNQDFELMEALFQSSYELSRETGVLIYQMFSLRNLGIAALRQGKLKRSREYYLENFSLSERVNWAENEWAKYDIYTFIVGMAAIALEMGQLTQAARLLGVVEAQFESFFKPLDIWDKAEYDRIAGAVRHQLDATAFESAWSTGRKLSLEEAIADTKQITP